jgi:7-cyano-7-deazaguanine synthase
MSRTGAVVLLSGGLDSTVALAMAREKCEPRWAAFFDYHQHARRKEEAASRRIAGYFGLRFERIELPWLGDLSSSVLVDGKGEPPEVSGYASAGSGDSSNRTVWVENRNGIFINIAAAFAAARDCGVIIVGFNREEALAFPDNSEDFLKKVNAALAISVGSPVRVESPTVSLVKREIVERGLALDIPWRFIWSCYRGGEKMCGSCESCAHLRRAVAGTPAGDAVVFSGG